MRTKTLISFMLLVAGFMLFACMPVPVKASPPTEAISFNMPSVDAANTGINSVMEMPSPFPTDPQRLYAFGNRTAVTLAGKGVVSITPSHTLTIYSAIIDSATTFNTLSTKAILGDRVVFKLSDTIGSTKHLTFGTNLGSIADSVVDNHTTVWEFIWLGDKYYLLSRYYH